MPDTKPPAPDHDAPQPEAAGEQPVSAASKTTVTPVVAMTFLIVVLLAILIAMRFRGPSKDQELAKLQAEIDQLTRHSGSATVPGLGGEQLQDIAARMKKDADSMTLLADRYKQLIDELNADLIRKNSDLLRSEQYRQGMTNDLVRLKNELQQAKSSSYEADSLRREVADLKTLRESQATELADLKKKLAEVGEMASKDDLADLQKRFDETLREKEFFESRAAELAAELAKQQSLFAKSENELLPAAVELFKTLRKLENQSDLEISKAYSRIGAELGAEVVKSLTFPTGSAKMNPADEEPVRQLIDKVADGDMLLVVGYASETGNVDGNRTLSSDRATGVAELLDSVKRPGQKVQAVYLGQTDRFGSRFPERNQCCEIWHIRAKQQ
jgi:outer membrane protein OmpA-like peptidoglycan-associated protein